MKSVQDTLINYMDSWVKEDRFSGTILVYKKDNVLFQRGYGYSNVQYAIKNTINTKYKIGSYTKQFTAVSILKLYENGKLNLEDKVKKYIPSYPHCEQITIHHLLSHTSGIPEHTSFEEYKISESITPEVILDRLNKRELNFAPGDRVEYSNSNYVLLALIVEIASGLDIETFYKKYIFSVIGLESTGISRNEDIIPGLAQGYSYSGQGVINADYYDMSGAYGSGFLYSNAVDLLEWLTSLLKGKIISLETLEKMLSPYGYLWYMDAHAGYGCFVKGEPVNEMCCSGLISGYVFNVWVDLTRETIVILLSNNDATASGRILKGIQDILVGRDPSVEIKPIPQKDKNSADIYKELEGKYTCMYTGGEFNISIQDRKVFVDRLWVQKYKGEKFKLEYIEETSDQVIYGCEVCDGKFAFTKNIDGTIKGASYTYDIFTLPYQKV